MTPNHLKYIKTHLQKLTAQQKPLQQGACGSYKNYFAPKELVTCKLCLLLIKQSDKEETET